MKKTKLILLLPIIFFVLFFIPTKVNASNELVTIQFVDSNLYHSVKEQVASKCNDTNDFSKTITMTRV